MPIMFVGTLVPSNEESNRPLPMVAQGAEYAKEKILESREKATFQKKLPPCRVSINIADSRYGGRYDGR